MSKRLLIALSASSLLLGGVAVAQTSGNTSGNTSGPAAGTSVQPSSAIQKQEGRSDSTISPQGSAGAGSPGTEAKPGSEGGARPTNNMNSNQRQ